ncbi:accessory Sec system glycosylation chaperone GtfB, partial [Liquorilactobacillus satsumensis]
MINIFDRNDQATRDLQVSLRKAGFVQPTVILQDDGWLPPKTESPFSWFLREDNQGRPLFFNQVMVPAMWEIRGDNNGGAIYDYERKAAEIVYAVPKNMRLIKEVRWLDQSGKVRSIDHYNQAGWRFAQTIYNLKGQAITKTYYSQQNKEVIVVNFVTHDLLLNYRKGIYNFQSFREFVKFYLKIRKYNLDRIFYNSLSDPFFISLDQPKAGKDLLFWQEPLKQSIPGNMQMILNGNAPRTEKIIFNEQTVFERSKKLITGKTAVECNLLGYIYEHKRENRAGNAALIMTNSDNLENFEYLVKNLPEIYFNVAAITEMSPKLMAFSIYKNVSLYPNASFNMLNNLWLNTDYYFDINHEGELMNAVRTAFDNNLVIFGFENVVHNQRYTSPENIYRVEDTKK